LSIYPGTRSGSFRGRRRGARRSWCRSLPTRSESASRRRTMFTPRSIDLRGTLLVDAPVEKAFPLFSPLGEKDWVPEWNPELIHPMGAIWERGQIFLTKEERGDALWVVTAQDREGHSAEYW